MGSALPAGARNCAQVTKENQPDPPAQSCLFPSPGQPRGVGAGVSLMPGPNSTSPSPDSMVEVAVRQPCWSW